MGSFIDGSKCCSPDPSASPPVVHRLRHIADPCIAHDNIPVAGRSLSVAHSGESRVPKELRVHCLQREVGVAINVVASTCLREPIHLLLPPQHQQLTVSSKNC